MTSSVLNLVISGMPSIPILGGTLGKIASRVLNLVISGMPSIPLDFARVLNSWLFSSFFNPRNI